MDLTETEGIKKRRQEYTELSKKDLNDLDNYYVVAIHPKVDILEYEVKWALGSISMHKASGGDGIPAELFKILKDDTIKVLHLICQQILNPEAATVLEKVSPHPNSQEGQY